MCARSPEKQKERGEISLPAVPGDGKDTEVKLRAKSQPGENGTSLEIQTGTRIWVFFSYRKRELKWSGLKFLDSVL